MCLRWETCWSSILRQFSIRSSNVKQERIILLYISCGESRFVSQASYEIKNVLKIYITIWPWLWELFPFFLFLANSSWPIGEWNWANIRNRRFFCTGIVTGSHLEWFLGSCFACSSMLSLRMYDLCFSHLHGRQGNIWERSWLDVRSCSLLNTRRQELGVNMDVFI